MTVHFIGAGPGAADLITLRAQRLIATCGVCLYAGALIPEEVLTHAHPGARIVDTRDLDLGAITEEMLAGDRAGHDIARLQSGDLSIYSAVAEQVRRLEARGVPWDMTPGVPAFAAAAAALGRELTVPEVSQAVILARHGARASKIPDGQRLADLAGAGATVVVHLGTQAIEEIAMTLMNAYGRDCPVAVVARVSHPDEIVIRGTATTIAAQVRRAGVRRTATIIAGPALGAEGFRDSHLYSTSRERQSPAPPR